MASIASHGATRITLVQARVKTAGSFRARQNSSDKITPIFTMSSGPPVPVYPPANPHTAPNSLLNGQNVLYNPYHVPITYMNQWQIDVQHQIAGFLFDVAYVGSSFMNLGFGQDANQVPESKLGPGNAQLSRPYSPVPDHFGSNFQRPLLL